MMCPHSSDVVINSTMKQLLIVLWWLCSKVQINIHASTQPCRKVPHCLILCECRPSPCPRELNEAEERDRISDVSWSLCYESRLHTLHSVIGWEQQFDVQKSPKHSKVIKKIQAEGRVSADHL